MSQTKSSDFFCKLMCVGSSAWVGSGKVPGERGHLLLPPHPPFALPRQCYEHTLVYKKVTRFCLAHHLWTSLYSHLEDDQNNFNFCNPNSPTCLQLQYHRTYPNHLQVHQKSYFLSQESESQTFHPIVFN